MSRPGFNFSIDSLIAPTLASRFGPMYGYFFVPPGSVSQVTSPSSFPPEGSLSPANFSFAHAAFTGHPFYSAANPYYPCQTPNYGQFQRYMRKDSMSPPTEEEDAYVHKEFNPLSSTPDEYCSEPTDLRKQHSPNISEKDDDEDFKSDCSETGKI